MFKRKILYIVLLNKTGMINLNRFADDTYFATSH